MRTRHCPSCNQMKPINGDWRWKYTKAGVKTHMRCGTCVAKQNPAGFPNKTKGN